MLVCVCVGGGWGGGGVGVGGGGGGGGGGDKLYCVKLDICLLRFGPFCYLIAY